MAKENSNGRIPYTIPLIPGLLEDDVHVCIEGKDYLIKRGVSVEIPPEVVYAIQRSDRLNLEASRRAQAVADNSRS